MPQHLSQQYGRLKAIASQDLGGSAVARLVSEMALYARQMLGRAERVQLTSRVADKRYFGFGREPQSRPINEALYVDGEDVFNRLLRAFRSGFRSATGEDIVRSAYTTAYSVFATNDVYGVGRKASATFFEILIGHSGRGFIGAFLSCRRKRRETAGRGRLSRFAFLGSYRCFSRELQRSAAFITWTRPRRTWLLLTTSLG